MKAYNKPTLKAVTFTHFVPCLFTGVVVLYITDALLPEGTHSRLVDNVFTSIDYLMAFVLGSIVAGIAVLFHLLRNKRLHKTKAVGRIPADSSKFILAAAVGFIAGASDVMLLLNTKGVIILTVIVLAILYWNLRLFFDNLVDMLHPDNVATWSDVSELARIYLTMLAGFTLVNATLEGARLIAKLEAPFGFSANGDLFLNSLYYTVVTMTTLGYGDFVPRTWDAKLLVIAQCAVSYVMFALVIGIITRGVIRAKRPEKE